MISLEQFEKSIAFGVCCSHCARSHAITNVPPSPDFMVYGEESVQSKRLFYSLPRMHRCQTCALPTLRSTASEIHLHQEVDVPLRRPYQTPGADHLLPTALPSKHIADASRQPCQRCHRIDTEGHRSSRVPCTMCIWSDKDIWACGHSTGGILLGLCGVKVRELWELSRVPRPCGGPQLKR